MVAVVVSVAAVIGKDEFLEGDSVTGPRNRFRGPSKDRGRPCTSSDPPRVLALAPNSEKSEENRFFMNNSVNRPWIGLYYTSKERGNRCASFGTNRTSLRFLIPEKKAKNP